MPGLRLTRRARPPAQLLRLLLSAAAAGVGFLLLVALAHALRYPGEPRRTLPGLAWCAVPLAATVLLSAVVWRAEAVCRRAAGDRAWEVLGVAVLRRYAAVATAVATVLGVLLALLVFLHLRGDLTGMPFDGRAADALAATEPLPLAATLTLLALVPLTAVPAAALAVRRPVSAPCATPGGTPGADQAVARAAGGGAGRAAPGRSRPAPALRAGSVTPPVPGPSGAGALAVAAVGGRTAPARAGRVAERDRLPVSLPWGAALLACGLALGAHAAWRFRGSGATDWAAAVVAAPPGAPGAMPWQMVAGWVLVGAGLVTLMPGLLVAAGQALGATRPGAVRLLAGRGLERHAGTLGPPLGALCAAGAAAGAVWLLNGPAFLGPFGTLGAAVVLLATGTSVAAVAGGLRGGREAARATLLRLGAAPSLAGRSAALGAATVAGVTGALVVVVAHLLALPLR